MAAIDETPCASVNRSNSRLRLLSWIPAVSPLVLLVVFGVTLLLSWPPAGDGDLPAFWMFAMQGLFIFAFYLAVPLWCVLAVYPASRPSPEVVGLEILFFIGGWLAFFLCAHAQPQLEKLFLGAQ